MKMEKPVGRSRGLSSPAVPLSRGNSFNNDSNNNNNNNNNNSNSKGLSLSHSLHQITSFMSTSFPHRSNSKTKDDKSLPSPEVVTLKEEFERKIAAVVFCLEEKAEENIDLSYKLKALQETSKQRESEKDRAIEDLHKALKSKEEECVQLEKKADNDEVLNELNRRIQTLTHCLNDMAEENLKLRTTVNANTNSVKQGARPNRGSTGSPFSPSHSSSSSSFSMEPEPPSSASFLSNLTASSTILSVARSSSSPSPSSCAPSTSSTSSSTSSSSSAPPSAHLKAIPATSSVSTNTSPVVTPAPAPPVKAVTLPDAVADMKSEIIAEELLKEGDWVKKFSSSYLVPVPPSNVLNLLSDIIKQDKARTEAKVKLSLDERITELESELKETEETLTTVKTSLAEETDRRGSLAESVEEYERKLKDLEGRMWDNLNKEAQRRTDAESKAKRLKKKVDELQFLLDELKDDGSDEEEDDEEEQAPQEENNNNNESSDSTSSDSSSSSSSSEEPQSKEDQQ